MTRVVYTDPAWAVDANGRIDRTRAHIERLVYGSDIAFDLGVLDDGRFVTAGQKLFDYVRGADAVVVYRCEVTRELLAAVGPQCKVVARQGVGIDNLNAELLHEHGICGFNVPDYCGDEVSTHAVALLLALERGVCRQNELVKRNRWNIYAGGIPRRTFGLTAGIVGYGRIGRATARKLQSLYGTVLAHDPYVSSDLMASYGVVCCDDLRDLVSSSDVVLLHAALTPETAGLVDDKLLASFKCGALLVNTARGRLVDVAAVLGALRNGRLGGFASDVFVPEDPNETVEGRELLERDDVVVTAHRAFLSAESEESVRRRVAEEVASVLRVGRPPSFGRVA